MVDFSRLNGTSLVYPNSNRLWRVQKKGKTSDKKREGRKWDRFDADDKKKSKDLKSTEHDYDNEYSQIKGKVKSRGKINIII